MVKSVLMVLPVEEIIMMVAIGATLTQMVAGISVVLLIGLVLKDLVPLVTVSTHTY